MENRLYLIHLKKVNFLYNSLKLKFGNTTKVETIFQNDNKPKVVVDDKNHLIGEGDKLISFNNPDGREITFKFGNNSYLEDLLNYYLISIVKIKLIGNKDINFIYNNSAIKESYLKTKVGYFFKNNDKPIIIVLDPKNLIGK